jgi:mono/diheme cytochrome c family protein
MFPKTQTQMKITWLNHMTLTKKIFTYETANIKYTGNVELIILENCAGCHNVSNPSKGILLDSYAEVKKSAENGSLLGSIEYLQGFTPMPLNQGKMNDCDIQKIKGWIKQGMPQ